MTTSLPKDTSRITNILKLIKNTIVIQGKKSGDIYLVNKHTGNHIACFDIKDNNWIAGTGELSLTYDPSENLTDADIDSDWNVIAY